MSSQSEKIRWEEVMTLGKEQTHSSLIRGKGKGMK